MPVSLLVVAPFGGVSSTEVGAFLAASSTSFLPISNAWYSVAASSAMGFWSGNVGLLDRDRWGDPVLDRGEVGLVVHPLHDGAPGGLKARGLVVALDKLELATQERAVLLLRRAVGGPVDAL